MDVDSRSLIALSVVALMLAAAAVALTFDLVPELPDTDAGPTTPQVLNAVPEVKRAADGEIKIVAADVAVTVDASTRASGAMLSCGANGVYRRDRTFERGKAVFALAPPEPCALTLRGAKAAYEPVFAGDTLNCMIVDDETHCTGGLASDKPALVAVESEVGGELTVDGDWYGPLPAPRLRLRPGMRKIRVQLDPLHSMEWNLLVSPAERVSVYFPRPEGWNPPSNPAP